MLCVHARICTVHPQGHLSSRNAPDLQKLHLTSCDGKQVSEGWMPLWVEIAGHSDGPGMRGGGMLLLVKRALRPGF